MIDDLTAQQHADAFATAAPADQARMRSELEEWRDNRAQARFARQASLEDPGLLDDHYERVFTDQEYFDGLAKSPRILEAAKVSKDPNGVAVESATRSFLDHVVGRELRDSFEYYRDGYAQKYFEKQTVSNGEFFTLLRGQFEQKKAAREALKLAASEIASSIFEDVETGRARTAAEITQQWKTANAEIFRPEWETPLLKAFGRMAQDNEAWMRKYGEPAREVFRSLSKQTGASQQDGATLDAEGLADLLVDMPDGERSKVYELAALVALKSGDPKGIFQQLGESLSRSITETAGAASLMAAEGSLNAMVNTAIRRGRVLVNEDGTAANSAKTPGYYPFMAATDAGREAALPEGTRWATDQEKGAAIDEWQRQLERIGVARDLNGLATGRIDPMRPIYQGLLGEIEKGGYAAAGSLPFIATAAIPWAGLPLAAAAYTAQEYDRIRAEYRDLPIGQAQAMAVISGGVQGALDRLQVEAVFGKLPATGRLLEEFARPGRSNFQRIAVASGLNFTEQAGQELVQNITPLVVDATAAALKADMPEFDWSGDLAEFGKALPTTFFALLPFWVLGTGKISFREFKRGEEFRQNVDGLMESFDLSGAEAQAVANASTPEAASKVFHEAWENKLPEERSAIIAREDKKFRQAEQSQANPAEGSMTREGDEFVIRDPAGKKFYSTPNEDSAIEAYADMEAAINAPDVAELRSMIEFFENDNQDRGRSPDAQAFEIRGEEKTLADIGGKESIEKLYERMRIEGIEPGTDPKSVAVLGENVGKLREGIYSDVSRLYNGATAMTVVHERLDGETKRAMAEGTRSKAWFVQEIQRSQDALGEVLLTPDAGGKFTDQAVVEAVTKLGEAYFAGRVRDSRLPEGLRAFFLQIVQYFNDVFRRAGRLRRAISEGKISGEFREYLADSVGLPLEDRAEQARRQYEAEMLEESRGAVAEAARGDELLAAVRRAGGLPAESNKFFASNAGELRMVRDAVKAQGKGAYAGNKGMIVSQLFSKAAPDPDILLQSLNEQGFEFQTVNDLWNALDIRLRSGEEHYGFRNDEAMGFEASYSIGEVTTGGREDIPVVRAEAAPGRMSDIHEWLRSNLLGKPLHNDSLDADFTVSAATARKITSHSARQKSTSFEAHKAAVVNLESLVKEAVAVSRPDRGGDVNIGAIHDLFVPMEFQGQIYRVKITGKEFVHPKNEKRLYSVEAVGIEISTGKTGKPVTEPAHDAASERIAGPDIDAIKVAEILPQSTLSVMPDAQAYAIHSALKALQKDPAERLGIYERARGRMDRIMSRNRDIVSRMRKAGAEKSDIDRTRMVQMLGEYEALLSVLPPVVRGKVGGFRKMAEFKTEGGRFRYLLGRVTAISEALETELRGEYHERILDMLKKARPKKGESGVAKSSVGPEAQKIAAKVLKATYLDEDATAGRINELDALLEKGNADPAIIEEWGILNTFGDLLNRDSEALASGYRWLKSVFKAGRDEQRIIREERFAKNRMMQNAIVAKFGKAGLPETFAASNKAWLENASNTIVGYFDDHYSFEQFLKTILPGLDEVTGELAARMRRADNAAQDAEIADREALLAVMRDAARQSGRSTAAVIDSLKTAHENVAEILDGRMVSNERIRIELAEKIVRGEVSQSDLSARDAEELRQQLAALPADTRKEYVEIKKVTFPGKPEKLTMSRAQAIQIVLSWEQPDVEGKMRAGGWMDETIADLRDFIGGDTAATSVLDFLREFYRGGARRVNPVYVRMFGMELPQVKNYAPTRFEHNGEAAEIGPDGMIASGGATPGFTRSRVSHSSPIATNDALDVFGQHIAQQAHWVHFAELARDFRALFANGDVRRSLRTVYGERVLTQIDRWARLLEQRGGDRAREAAWLNQGLGAVISGKAVSSLGFNLKSIAMQVDSVSRFVFALEGKQFVSAFSDPAALVQSMPKVWFSDTVQRRLKGGMNPEAQFLFRRSAAKPGLGSMVGHAAMTPINFMDAVFTTIGSAAVYRAAYNEVIAAGGNEVLAEAQALDAMDAAVYRYSQPTGFGSKSAVENAAGTTMRMWMMFLSDARLKSAIMMEAARGIATGQGDPRTHLKNIITIEAMALVSHVIASFYRDAFSDDSDEDIWSLSGFGKAAALAPFQGFFLLGAVSDSLMSYLFQEHFFTPSRDPVIDATQRSLQVARNLDDTLNFDDPAAMHKQWENIARAMALSPGMAAPAAALNLIKPVVGLKENLETED